MNLLKKILLVDDADYFLKLKEGFLQRSDCVILKAGSGEEGLTLAKEASPSLVIMDLSMPGMKGDECCRTIKNDPELKQIPVIMVANGWEKDAMKRCTEAGCDDFISKPINKPRLYAGIKRFIQVVERAHERIPCQNEVVYSANGGECSGVLNDVSEGGLFIRSEAPFAEGTDLTARFKLSKLGDTIETQGRVVRSVNGNRPAGSPFPTGMGVQFIKLSTAAQTKIKHFALVKNGNL